MSSEFLAPSLADERRQFHLQTQQLHAGAVAIARKGEGFLLPLSSDKIAAAFELLNVGHQLCERGEILADFAAAFENNSSCFWPPTEYTSYHEAAIQVARYFLSDLLELDLQVSTGLAVAARVIDPPHDMSQRVHYCALSDDQRAKICELGESFTLRWARGDTMLWRDRYAIICVDDKSLRTIEGILHREAAHCQKLFAPGEGSFQQTPGEIDRWLSVSKAATAAGVKEYEITRAANRGDLVTNGKKGRARLISGSSLATWQLNRAQQPDPVESDAAIQRKLLRAKSY